MSALLGGIVLLPLLGALVCGVAGDRWRAPVALLSGAGTVALVASAVVTVYEDGPQRVFVAGYAPPVGISLVVDGLSAVFVTLTAVVGLAVTVYASGSPKARGGGMYWALWLGLWSALNAVFLSGDLFNTYVALELMGLAAVGLVALAGRSALAAAFRYLMIAVLGSLLYLLGVALVYAELGTLDLEQIGASSDDRTAFVAAMVLITVGMALKSALFPLHGWLPAAHGGAPSAVSPLLSALVIKASVYVVVRLWATTLPGVGSSVVAQVLGVLGAIAVLWGTVLALRQERLKLVVAYSTVAQVGYFFLVFPLAFSDGLDPGVAEDGWAGALLIALAHGLAKAAMFMSAGTLALAHGSDRVAGLVGAATRRPVACATFALAGVSLAGLPPSAAFGGKWLVMQSSLAGGQWWWAVVLLGGGLLTAAYVGRVLRVTFVSSPPDGAALPDLQPVPRRMEAAGMVLALLAVGLGLRLYEPVRLLLDAAPIGGAG